MRLCTRCWYTSNHPLNLVYDELGVCSGCRVHEEKDRLDWTERAERLGSLLNSFRSRSGNNSKLHKAHPPSSRRPLSRSP